MTRDGYVWTNRPGIGRWELSYTEGLTVPLHELERLALQVIST